MWFTFSRQRRIRSFHVAALQRAAKKCTKNQNARAQSLFCSLSLFFSDVLVAAAVVFYVRSLNDTHEPLSFLKIGSTFKICSVVLVNNQAEDCILCKVWELLSLSKPRRRRQRERHQTKGLMSKTIAEHVRYKSFYYMAASHKDWELPNSRI